jgi:hypothetical protein
LAPACFQNLGLIEIRMILDLIANQRFRTERRRLLDQCDSEVRHADVTRHAEPPDVGKSAQSL